MTLQTGNLRRAVTVAVASSALAVGLLMGIGASTALAEPGESCTGGCQGRPSGRRDLAGHVGR